MIGCVCSIYVPVCTGMVPMYGSGYVYSMQLCREVPICEWVCGQCAARGSESDWCVQTKKKEEKVCKCELVSK